MQKIIALLLTLSVLSGMGGGYRIILHRIDQMASTLSNIWILIRYRALKSFKKLLN